MPDTPDPDWIAERKAAHRDLLRRMGVVWLGMAAFALAVTAARTWIRF